MSRFSGSVQDSYGKLAQRKQDMKNELRAEKEAKKADKNAAKDYMMMVQDMFETADRDASGNLDYEELFDLLVALYQKEGVEATEEEVGMQLDSAYAEVSLDSAQAVTHRLCSFRLLFIFPPSF